MSDRAVNRSSEIAHIMFIIGHICYRPNLIYIKITPLYLFRGNFKILITLLYEEYKPVGSNTENHLIDFMTEIPELLNTLFAY